MGADRTRDDRDLAHRYAPDPVPQEEPARPEAPAGTSFDHRELRERRDPVDLVVQRRDAGGSPPVRADATGEDHDRSSRTGNEARLRGCERKRPAGEEDGHG